MSAAPMSVADALRIAHCCRLYDDAALTAGFKDDPANRGQFIGALATIRRELDSLSGDIECVLAQHAAAAAARDVAAIAPRQDIVANARLALQQTMAQLADVLRRLSALRHEERSTITCPHHDFSVYDRLGGDAFDDHVVEKGQCRTCRGWFALTSYRTRDEIDVRPLSTAEISTLKLVSSAATGARAL